MANTTAGKRPPPVVWKFNERDRSKYGAKYWACPRRLVTDGIWAQLWREPGTARGGGAATSLLPLLALHNRPGRAERSDGWTPWRRLLSVRRLQALVGINKDTVSAGLALLEDAGLLARRWATNPRNPRERRMEYRLALSLFPTGPAEKSVPIPGRLFYSGIWGILPSSAARHLYVVVACLDPIANVPRYLADAEAREGFPGWNKVPEVKDAPAWDKTFLDLYGEEHAGAEWFLAVKHAYLMARRRSKGAASHAYLARVSGLEQSTVRASLRVLEKPIFGGKRHERTYPPIPLVHRGDTGQLGTVYAVNPRALEWSWPVDTLNRAGVAKTIRSEKWPELVQRATRRANRATFRAGGVSPSSAWGEAQRLAEEFRLMEQDLGGLSRSAFARRKGLQPAAVSVSLNIAQNLTQEVVEAAGVRVADLERLGKNTLYDAVKGLWTRATVADRADKLRRVVEDARRRRQL